MFKRQWKKICRKKRHFRQLNLQLRVQNLVRKLKPDRVRSQLQCLISSVSEGKGKLLRQHFAATTASCDVTAYSETVIDGSSGPDNVDVQVERGGGRCSEEPRWEEGEACELQRQQQAIAAPANHATVMSADYSASSEADSGGGGQHPAARPTKLALTSSSSSQPISVEPPMPLPLPTLIVESDLPPAVAGAANSNAAAAAAALALLCTPSQSPSPRNKSPVTVQEWVDSLPLTPVEPTRPEDEPVGEPSVTLPPSNETDDILTLGAEAGLLCVGTPAPAFPSVQVTTCREPSEAGSHCSSVESLLEARRPDPEEVLLGLGFGGGQAYTADTGRIPARFLQPSKLKGVAIDDFLRHQQDLVHNFESGYWGYRGLTGPSHTIPSVIVAKIMEKLREHERENSVASPPPPPPTHMHTHLPPPRMHRNSNSTNHKPRLQPHPHDDANKFSRVAHNVLTKIRCGSVLTPDNRKWLDSQGDKSPELARRRLILGQQSFTFSRDGDLIESPPSSLTDSDRWTSSTGTTGHNKVHLEPPSKEVRVIFPSIEEDLIDADHVTSSRAGDDDSDNNNNNNSNSNDNNSENNINERLSPQLDDILVENNNHCCSSSSVIVNETTAVQQPQQQQQPQQLLSATSSFELEETDGEGGGGSDKQWMVSMADSGLASSGRSSRGLEELESPSNAHAHAHALSEKQKQCDDECNQDSLVGSVNKTPEVVDGDRRANSDKVVGMGNDFYPLPADEMIQSLDKVIESLEKIIEPLELGCAPNSVKNDDVAVLREQYDDLCQLTAQMRAAGLSMECGTQAQFVSLTAYERCALQCRVVRAALSAYHAQLSSDDMHLQLKTYLGVEVQRLADLLDSTNDCDRLATIVKQMTCLLEHQSHLSEQLKGLVVGEEPFSCHELCEAVIRRVRSLELLVRRNARELAEIRKRSSS